MPKDSLSLSVAPACAALLFLSGCDWLRPGGPPDEARVEISSDDVDNATVILSQNLVWADDPDCPGDQPGECDPILQVVSADTAAVALPYTNTIKFTSRHMLLTETHPTDEVDARVGMRVSIDGQERYNAYRLLRVDGDEGARQTLRFVYTYGGRPLNNGGVGG